MRRKDEHVISIDGWLFWRRPTLINGKSLRRMLRELGMITERLDLFRIPQPTQQRTSERAARKKSIFQKIAQPVWLARIFHKKRKPKRSLAGARKEVDFNFNIDGT